MRRGSREGMRKRQKWEKTRKIIENQCSSWGLISLPCKHMHFLDKYSFSPGQPSSMESWQCWKPDRWCLSLPPFLFLCSPPPLLLFFLSSSSIPSSSPFPICLKKINQINKTLFPRAHNDRTAMMFPSVPLWSNMPSLLDTCVYESGLGGRVSESHESDWWEGKGFWLLHCHCLCVIKP